MSESYKPIKLSVQAGAREFGVNRSTLTNKLRDQQPDANGRFSIKQIASVLFTPLAAAKVEESRVRAKYWDIKNRMMLGELLNRELVEHEMYKLSVQIGKLFSKSGITDDKYDKIMDAVNSGFKALEKVSGDTLTAENESDDDKKSNAELFTNDEE